VPRPAKGFQPKLFAEPKRHASAKIISTDTSSEQNTSMPASSAQYYQSHLQIHRTGVSTPPPPGMQYYPQQPYPNPYNPYGHYSSSALPQAYVQNFAGLTLEEQSATMNPYPMIPNPYYPMYAPGYPAPPMFAQPALQYYPQSQQQIGTPKKKKTMAQPSKFKPVSSNFIRHDTDYGEHAAENEESIISLIKEYESHEGEYGLIKGRVSELAVTQTGSRFLQKQLTKASPDFVSFVLNEVFFIIRDITM